MTEPSLFDLDDAEPRSKAVISSDGHYRYLLTRWWDDREAVTWIMLNPSTADANQDDPTIRRCVGFAKAWGFGAINVVNLFAYRATDPGRLTTAADPVGPENDEWLQAYTLSGLAVAAWGGHKLAQDRASGLLKSRVLPADLRCVGVTRAGAPRHPLYVRGSAQPEPWPVVA